ncbi:hypothetical protein PRECH8_04000 [Insulibacter thermoxylanivorax]|uniref:Transcription factor zinc-finger domain-containing protein n=1 Tax=Insulibacter thermoxylanivorax TaxID=2749268 RepID=A0A916QDS1_9BACL|nr:zf-TFIIB domain-containing protein [Insulibacter thermoxylanivorax]GFR37104.1 hypothetical protein PRECH8_04000 [Insulibacter thermoxylanivorax]
MEREGVLIDACPTCKGVWLDRGELEKLMADEREDRWYEREYEAPSSSDPYRKYSQDRRRDHKRRTRSMLDILDDLFD